MDQYTTHTVETGDEQIEERFRFQLYRDLSLDADPCPHCGSEGFFNASWTGSGQYAQVAPDDNEGEYSLDDLTSRRLKRLQCGNCREPLVVRGDDTSLHPKRLTTDDGARTPTEKLSPYDPDSANQRRWKLNADPPDPNTVPAVVDSVDGVGAIETIDGTSPEITLALYREPLHNGHQYHAVAIITGSGRIDHMKITTDRNRQTVRQAMQKYRQRPQEISKQTASPNP